ncbi:MAG: methylenetetrahydrofolate reductase C-terminal domain-containing protein [Planctomycetota bacterium]|jgi:ferredoxin
MIVAERKPFEEIIELVGDASKVLVLGCGSCVTVCLTGGERQAEMLASQLSIAARRDGKELTADFDCITRQCDREFTDDLRDLSGYDAVLSIACGVGVGYMSELYPDVKILPGMDTTFYGANTAEGLWEEYCHGCGDCALGWTGGVCPVARCSKSLINGACGGTNDGKCEVSNDMDCAWSLIYTRLKDLGRLDELRKMRPARQWSKDRSKGVRRLSREEMAEVSEEAAQ